MFDLADGAFCNLFVASSPTSCSFFYTKSYPNSRPTRPGAVLSFLSAYC